MTFLQLSPIDKKEQRVTAGLKCPPQIGPQIWYTNKRVIEQKGRIVKGFME
jgi:hypothetical protein